MDAACEQCGAAPHEPHTWTDNDCILDHNNHAQRHIGLICKRHYHWIDNTLGQILELWKLMPDAIERGAASTGRPSGEVFSPAPGRLDVMALTDPRAKTPIDLEPDEIPDLPGTLSSWAQKTHDERGGQLDDDVEASIAYLRRERHWIAQQPDVDDLVLELAYLHHAIARAVGDTMWPQPIGRCPNCGTALFNTIGVDEVTCRRCKSSWKGVDLARLRLILEQDKVAQT